MIRFKEFRILERAERLPLGSAPGNKMLKIIIDPKEVEFRAMLKRSGAKEIRGLIDQKTLIIWDSHEATHNKVIRKLESQLKVKGNFMHIYVMSPDRDDKRLLVDISHGGFRQSTTSLAAKWPYLTFDGLDD